MLADPTTAAAITDADRHAAIRRRDPAFDGAFVFSVRTTGVYCRPSCAARPAKPENVAFHLTCDAAERAGFRACKRCRPNEPSQAQRNADAVARAVRLLEAAEDTPDLRALATEAGLSRFHFHRVFRRVTGTTPRAYLAAYRARQVQERLLAGEGVTGAIYGAGYGAPSRFYEQASARLGMAPAAYRNGGSGTAIRFALGQCSLGTILVAATEKGVCAILLGEDPAVLLRDLQDRFPRADLQGADPAFGRTLARVVALVERPGTEAADLPLDIGGTAFQQRVWAALRAIPPGRTATYAEVAAAIGQPTAARAVARACAANKLAVAIPCHRVVRLDGAPGGYRWGLARKNALLARESA